MKRGKTEAEIAHRFRELEPVQLEAGTEYLIMLFDDLSDTRHVGYSGPLAVTNTEIKAFCDLTGTILDPWEMDAIRRMDKAFLEEANQIQSGRTKDTRPATKATRSKQGK